MAYSGSMKITVAASFVSFTVVGCCVGLEEGMPDVGLFEGLNVDGSTVDGFTAGARLGDEVRLFGGLGWSGGKIHVTLIRSDLGNQ